jgi:hypothetical protein
MVLHHEKKKVTARYTHFFPFLREKTLIGWVPFYKHTSHPSTLSNERKPTISEEQIHLQQVKLVVIHL